MTSDSRYHCTVCDQPCSSQGHPNCRAFASEPTRTAGCIGHGVRWSDIVADIRRYEHERRGNPGEAA